jgi:hypothetical protein
LFKEAKTKKYILITSILFIAFFMSCTPPVYLPNSLNIPLLTEKDEFNIGLNGSSGGYDLQTSRAISGNVGLMVNGTYLSDSWSDNYRRHKFAEFGIGRFSHPDKYLVGEIYIGGGVGSNSLKEDLIFDSEDARVSANYIRLFIQGAFGAYTEGFEGGFSMRMCYVNFYKINYSNIDFLRTKILFEPIVFFRFGPPVIQFETQFGFSLDPFEDPLEILFYDEFIFSLGFNIRLNIKETSE